MDAQSGRPLSPARIAQSLSRIYLFREFDADALARLAHATTAERFSPEQVIAREGTPGDALFMVASGAARVAKLGAGGDEEQVVILAPGQHFGEISLLDGAPRSATVAAAEPCDIYRLPAGALMSVLDADPRLAAAFFRALSSVLASRLRATTDDVAFLKHLAREAKL